MLVVHDDDGGAVFADDARHVGVALQAPDVVDDAGAEAERFGGDDGLGGVDGDRQGMGREEATKCGADALAFLFLRGGSPAGARGFASEVEDVGAFGSEAQAVLACLLGLVVVGAVEKGVGGDVDDAHYERARAERDAAVAGIEVRVAQSGAGRRHRVRSAGARLSEARVFSKVSIGAPCS